MTRTLVLLLTLFGLVVASQPATAESPVADLERHAHPLRTTEPNGGLADLRPLGRMVSGATVVGVGEATHNSHEFFTLKHRIFRYLVAEKGFRTFSLEASWSTGLRLNDYVLRGTGDPAQIMRDEFQNAYIMWNTQEYLDLIEWMRAYNTRHHDKVRFMGNDIGWVGPELYDTVTGWVGKRRPDLLAEITGHYQNLRPTTDVHTYMTTYPQRPLADRQRAADRARQAQRLVTRLADPRRDAWIVQHARTIAQLATIYGFDLQDPAGVRDAMRYRDQAMADNTAWWHEQTGDHVLLSAHNGHIALTSYHPDVYPKVQGEFLRERLGRRYVNVGLSFHHGSFNAFDAETGVLRTFTVGAAPVGNNEHTLDQVRWRDYLLDLRTTPPAATAWLREPRPTRVIGTGYPTNDFPVALARAYDVLIHLNQVTAAQHRGMP